MTRERKILLFNDPFLSMLRNRFSLGEVQQLARGLKFLIDTHVDDALDTFERNQGTIIKTSFTVSPEPAVHARQDQHRAGAEPREVYADRLRLRLLIRAAISSRECLR